MLNYFKKRSKAKADRLFRAKRAELKDKQAQERIEMIQSKQFTSDELLITPVPRDEEILYKLSVFINLGSKAEWIEYSEWGQGFHRFYTKDHIKELISFLTSDKETKYSADEFLNMT